MWEVNRLYVLCIRSILDHLSCRSQHISVGFMDKEMALNAGRMRNKMVDAIIVLIVIVLLIFALKWVRLNILKGKALAVVVDLD